MVVRSGITEVSSGMSFLLVYLQQNKKGEGQREKNVTLKPVPFSMFFFSLQEARRVFHETGLVTDKSLALLAGGARWRCGEQ